MENEGVDYFFSYPAPLFVKLLTRTNVETAVRALCEASQEEFNAFAVMQSSR